VTVEERLASIEPTILNLVKYNKVNNYEEGDLAQDLRFLAFKLHDKFDETKGVTFKTYFVASAKNLIRKAHTKRNEGFRVVSLNEVDDFGEEFGNNLPNEENDYDESLLIEILGLIDDMPMGFLTKEYYIDDMTQEELAEKYNISQQMVSKNLKNNIKILKGITKEWL
jgi:RNA polymerase sigma factor (sigma-70 family)